MSLKILQNFFKATITEAIDAGSTKLYVSVAPTPSAGYLVINPSNVTKREIVRYTAVGNDAGGDFVTLSSRGVGGTTDQAHDILEPVRMNITAELYSEVQDEIDALDTDLQGQIDSLVATGSVPATTTALGISKMSTAPANPANPIAVGTNDTRLPSAAPDTIYVRQDALINTSAGAADAGKGVKLNSSGVLDNSFLNLTFTFGDGSDGDVTISSPTTLTKDMYYNNLIVNDTLSTDGFRIFVKGTLSGNGTIQGVNGNNGTSGDSTGAGGTASGTGTFKTVAGGAGSSGIGSGASGGAGNIGSNGSNGGNATGTYIGGAGGVVSKTLSPSIGFLSFPTTTGLDVNSALSLSHFKCSGGGGGGCSSASGKGGGGGASGGFVLILANTWTGTFTIKSIGGNGANGNTSWTYSAGGSGGNGGHAVVVYKTKTWSGSYTLTGGTGGNTSGYPGGGSSPGISGVTGTSYEISIYNLR